MLRPLLDRATGQHWGEPTLDLDRLGDLEPHTLEQVLRHWCRQLGLEPPGRERLREFVRQLSAGEQLAAVADLWVCEGAEAPAGETGYGLRWIPLGCR